MLRTNLVLAFFVAAIVAGLLLRFNVLRREGFMQRDAGMPIGSAGIGPYDQVNQVGGISGWASTEMPVGSMPVATPQDPNKLMYLESNAASASCCPSAFSSDMGCLCLSGADLDLMASRGGNK